MSRVENTPEKLNATPTEASKGFLAGWSEQALLAMQVTNIGVDSLLAGLSAAQGEPEKALLWGIVGGCFGVAAVLNAVAMKNK